MVALTEKRKQSNKRSAEPVDIVWMNTKEAAAHIKQSPGTLQNWRSLQLPDKPKSYKKPGSRFVLYKKHELDAWAESNPQEF